MGPIPRYTELQLSDKDLDQEFVETTTFKVIIYTSPRTVSFFLFRQMHVYGTWCTTRVF
jgi:hypothetical protein